MTYQSILFAIFVLIQIGQNSAEASLQAIDKKSCKSYIFSPIDSLSESLPYMKNPATEKAKQLAKSVGGAEVIIGYIINPQNLSEDSISIICVSQASTEYAMQSAEYATTIGCYKEVNGTLKDTVFQVTKPNKDGLVSFQCKSGCDEMPFKSIHQLSDDEDTRTNSAWFNELCTEEQLKLKRLKGLSSK